SVERSVAAIERSVQPPRSSGRHATVRKSRQPKSTSALRQPRARATAAATRTGRLADPKLESARSPLPPAPEATVPSPTEKLKVPRTGCVSAEITRQATMYVPRASGPTSTTTTEGAARRASPRSTRPSFPSKTRTPPNRSCTCSLNSRRICFGAVSRTEPAGGSVFSSAACASAGTSGRISQSRATRAARARLARARLTFGQNRRGGVLRRSDHMARHLIPEAPLECGAGSEHPGTDGSDLHAGKDRRLLIGQTGHL